MVAYDPKNNIIYDTETKQGEFIFPNYQKQINFSTYEKIKKREKIKDTSQLELKLKWQE